MRFRRIEIALNVLFWILATWFIVSKAREIESIEIIDEKKQITYIRNYERMFVFFLAQVFFLIFFYIELYLIGRLKRPKAVRGFVLKSLGLFIATPILYLFLVQKVLFPDSESANNLVNLSLSVIYYMAIVILYGFTKKWIQQEQDKSQLERNKQQAELNLLRQQLQPHFLFNTMNNLLSMVDQTRDPKLAQSIDKLSDLLRYVVYDIQHQKVTIASEIDFIKNFAELHLLRFEEEEVDFDLTVTDGFNQQAIEPGIFLCYVENAFKHGVQPEETAFIHIAIDLTLPNKVQFTIENSLPEQPLVTEGGGYGIQSNQERLSLVYPDRHEIAISETDTYKVQVTIETNEDDHSR